MNIFKTKHMKFFLIFTTGIFIGSAPSGPSEFSFFVLMMSAILTLAHYQLFAIESN